VLTYTEIPGAEGIDSYLEALRAGHGQVGGASGTYVKLTRCVLGIAGNFVRERPWAAALAPLMLIVPLVTLGNYFRELTFQARWAQVLWPTTPPEEACSEPVEI